MRTRATRSLEKSEEGRSDEEDGGGKPQQTTARSKRAAPSARSYACAWVAAMIWCIVAFLGATAYRLDSAASSGSEERHPPSPWPVYIDFIPIFILPLFWYLLVADFIGVQMSEMSTGSKAAIAFVGFCAAVAIMALGLLVCLRLSDMLDWRWMVVLTPVWLTLGMMQMVFCFIAPGLLHTDMMTEFVVFFMAVWLVAFAALLVGLKADGEVSSLSWWVVLGPLFPAGFMCVLALNDFKLECARWVLHPGTWLLLSLALLPLRLDSTISWYWWAVLLPGILVLAATAIRLIRPCSPRV